MSDERRAIHAYLSEEGHDAWQVFAEGNGVSVTGLLESLGLTLADEMLKKDATGLRQDWVTDARKIDARRRRRGMQ